MSKKKVSDLQLSIQPEDALVDVSRKILVSGLQPGARVFLPDNADKKFTSQRGILASIVEGEAKIKEERPILAGIFLNRIEKWMPLQSCATVIYCWDELGIKKKSLTYKDLEIDSPYNTYRNSGLPPGPISVPSEDSWISALQPAKTDYLFFFATSKGSHIFSKTYEEHLRKQRERTE